MYISLYILLFTRSKLRIVRTKIVRKLYSNLNVKIAPAFRYNYLCITKDGSTEQKHGGPRMANMETQDSSILNSNEARLNQDNVDNSAELKVVMMAQQGDELALQALIEIHSHTVFDHVKAYIHRPYYEIERDQLVAVGTKCGTGLVPGLKPVLLPALVQDLVPERMPDLLSDLI